MEKRKLEVIDEPMESKSVNHRYVDGGATPPKQDRVDEPTFKVTIFSTEAEEKEVHQEGEKAESEPESDDDDVIITNPPPPPPKEVIVVDDDDDKTNDVDVADPPPPPPKKNIAVEGDSDDKVNDVDVADPAPPPPKKNIAVDGNSDDKTNDVNVADPPPPPPKKNIAVDGDSDDDSYEVDEDGDIVLREGDPIPFVPPSSSFTLHLSQILEVMGCAYSPTASYNNIVQYIAIRPIGMEDEGITLTHRQFDRLIVLSEYINAGMRFLRNGERLRKIIGLGENVFLTINGDYPTTPMDITLYGPNAANPNSPPVPTPYGQVLSQSEWYMLYRLLSSIHLRLVHSEVGVRQQIDIRNEIESGHFQ
jgi:hypothetical protein